MVLAYSCTVCAWAGTEPRRAVDGVTRCPDCGALADPTSFPAKVDDGGPAFPRPASVQTTYDYKGRERTLTREAQDGLSLRDYFAAKAMAGLLADSEMKGSPAHFAEYAYEYADAMLAQRQKERT
jgi:hypothetical protein